ncbi:hypothetical protein [Petrocella sp. FN5]|uniref:hypothetical protein n=1 Tax=Petrocella sp. FN5 TaxID=3032002 RepID=UPI0023DC7B74|nr:hypothetical protein [Petrocella sp. FN5]MDF1618629.1 hypothetical protein [Petrocella sp. FN5]
MKYYLIVIVIVIIVLVGCSGQKDSAVETELNQMEIESLQDELINSKRLIKDLRDTITDLEKTSKTTEDLYNSQINTLQRENTDLNEYMMIVYRDANLFRNDIYELLFILTKDNEYPFNNLDHLNDEQQLAVIEGIQSSDGLNYMRDESIFEEMEFWGERPYPQTIFYVLGIYPSAPMFYTSEYDNEVVHLTYKYYLADVPLDSNTNYVNQKNYQLRSFIDGINEYHIVIEKINNHWECVYNGLG